MTESTHEVEVRPARPDELGQVASLRWHWVHGQPYGGANLPSHDDYVAAAVAWARARADSHVAFIARSSDAAVGMAWLALLERVPAPDRMQRVNGDLQSCYVLREFRGRGIGNRLVAAVLQEAGRRGCEHVTVHASPLSVPMYERAGFEHSPELLWNVPDGA
ncbi:GNAT family N-acetyltransferase [Occultella glacieicola]|uniref:GNAT family N-acetyltransferase n=1 Tax=Occultella glacieicola TaxID=2518684 RepID=UPI0014054EED|nr:GNAT family N-acetyltransferase [Occultella glacieicola]